ncbi:energy-coupling factor transporter ATPase [Thalassorhabdus alkalitolerans]|uniref:Energy-coupling factor transporter ATP-binding protein EcfA2 n=1 Tax=Thalassorhabdus alkalitolerans TaxID=2282697 RepID=A0ABW0YMV9_9BACI|nr:energy-coupling factor transporter ATPase [Thalassobacillus sp. C254]
MEVKFENVTHRYMKKTPFEALALNNVSAHFPSGSFSAVIGRTGSGKSTLVQHVNGLIKPSEGRVLVGGKILHAKAKRKEIKAVRRQVGMVFQYPEHQLFEDTVEADLLFGPKNMGKNVVAVKKELPALLEKVGLPERILSKSPFDLSGGQMRRVAIASVLAMDPKILILDEPTAGLDPKGQEEIISLFKKWHEEKGTTTIMITHQMEEAARLADNIYVMNEGKIVMSGSPQEVYQREEDLLRLDLDLPEPVRLLNMLEKEWDVAFSSKALSAAQAAEEIGKGKEGRK